jgi:hypothetical protein
MIRMASGLAVAHPMIPGPARTQMCSLPEVSRGQADRYQGPHSGVGAQAVVPVPRLLGIELVDTLTPLAHRVSPEEPLAGRARGDYEAFCGARFLAATLTDPRTGPLPSARGCAVIAHKSPAGHWPGDAPTQAPGGQPVPQNPRAVAGRGCSAPVLPRWARYPADHRLHLLTHLEAANAGLTGHARALRGRRIPAAGPALWGPSAGLRLACVAAGTAP